MKVVVHLRGVRCRGRVVLVKLISGGEEGISHMLEAFASATFEGSFVLVSLGEPPRRSSSWLSKASSSSSESCTTPETFQSAMFMVFHRQMHLCRACPV